MTMTTLLSTFNLGTLSQIVYFIFDITKDPMYPRSKDEEIFGLSAFLIIAGYWWFYMWIALTIIDFLKFVITKEINKRKKGYGNSI